MNKHILLVMKWLNNPESVSQEELDANRESAYDAYRSVRSACWAASAAEDDDSAAASHWVDKYFGRSGENKQTYIDKLGE
jgi:uncharacterized FlgJ-related protein